MLYTRLILLAKLALLFCLPVKAADINLVRGAKGEEDTITIKGEFKLDDEIKFRKIALATNNATVLLDSNGGRVQPALEIGKMIRIKGFSTAVQSAHCSSACSMVWLAGEPRMMSNFSSIGFHSAFSYGSDGKPASGALEGALYGSYLTNLGFSSRVVLFVVTAGAKDMHWLTKTEADKFGIAVNMTTLPQRRRSYAAFQESRAKLKENAPEDAAKLLKESATIGYAGSQNNLGDMYENGEGLPKDEKAAMYWYTRAAERGEPTAYFSIAHLLSKGATDTDVLIECAKFAALAVAHLPEGKNKLEAQRLEKEINAKLTPANRQLVLDLVSRWSPLFQEDRLLGDSKR